MKMKACLARTAFCVMPSVLLASCGGGDGSALIPSTPAPPASPAPAPTPTPTPTPAPTAATTDYHLTFDDEFNSVDLSAWQTADFWDMRNNAGDYQGQWFANPTSVPSYSTKVAYNAFSTTNGVLSITAQPTPATVYAGEDKTGAGRQPYVSGQLTSAHRFTQRYGYFELRAKLPPGKGIWSRFWFLTDDGARPGEFDVFEVLGKESNTVRQASIYASDTNAKVTDSQVYKGINATDGQFHTYGFLWDATTVTFYVDGVASKPLQNHTNIPMYVLIDLAIGNDPGNLWPGTPDASTIFPKSMEIDYFRVYSNDPALPAATPQTGYSPSTLPSGLRIVSAPTTAMLQTGWTAGPVGTPVLQGSTTWNAFTGEWIVKGAGDGYQPQFAATTLAADGQITARLDSVSIIANQTVRAGVTMRATRIGSDPEISLDYISPPTNQATGTRLVLNARQGGKTVELGSVPFTPSAVTLRLIRQGTSFTGSYSTDNGASWTNVGQTTSTALSGPLQTGLTVGSSLWFRLARAFFTRVAVTAT